MGNFEHFEKNNTGAGQNESRGTKEARENLFIKEVSTEARKKLAEGAFDPRDFVKHYGEEAVKRDLEKVEIRKASFEDNEMKRLADILEAVIYEHAELSEWMGSKAETIRTSEYDDVMNGIDMIVEFNDNDASNHLALAIDVTFASKSMDEKFYRIKKEIDNGTLAEVKYFKSHGFTGTLDHVPRIIIGVEKDTVLVLAELWKNKKNNELGDHFAKDVILKEILLQLDTFLTYAKHQPKVSGSVIKSYTRALNIVKKILNDNHGQPQSPQRRQSIESDKVFMNIQDQMKSFKPLPVSK